MEPKKGINILMFHYSGDRGEKSIGQFSVTCGHIDSPNHYLLFRQGLPLPSISYPNIVRCWDGIDFNFRYMLYISEVNDI